MTNDIQIITIANAFELVYQHVEPYVNLSTLARVDERHFGQKAAFWLTPYGSPSIVICTAAPSDRVLDATYGDRLLPVFIEPKRTSSAICLDLLADLSARSTLLSVLDRSKKVFLAPYVHTSHVENLAAVLMDAGYVLLDYRRQADLVRLLWDKTNAERIVFQPVHELRKHRPISITADSEDDLLSAISRFARQGIRKIVVKSAAAVGGAGVFFLDSHSVKRGLVSEQFLLGIGQNEADRSVPFLIEEHEPWDESPTVDIEVTQSGQVEVMGIALQRLYDGRYYTGFYASPVLANRWWFKGIEKLAEMVGGKLAQLGYLGPANIDFVVSSSQHRITLIEVNPRRSALIDGFSLRRMKHESRPITCISIADYINISDRFASLHDAFTTFKKESGIALPVADGGFSSDFRWVGVWACGFDSLDSEDTLEQAVLHLQDPEREEVGLAERQAKPFDRISENISFPQERLAGIQ